jgi:ribosomal protein S8
MVVNNKFKSCLAKIKVAQLNNKKKLKIKLSLVETSLLDILWLKGFIYGYERFGKYLHIFLKYNCSGRGLLASLSLGSYRLSSKELINLLRLDYYSGYFVVTPKKKVHFYSGNYFLNLNQLIGTEVIAKV